MTPDLSLPDTERLSSYQNLLEDSVRVYHGVVPPPPTVLTADDYKQAEMALFRQVQRDSFPEDS